jgi:uncharacterized repeat protein (TIGR01451 family)
MKEIYVCLLAVFALLVATSNSNAQTYFITGVTQQPDSMCQGDVTYQVSSNVFTAGQKVEASWGNATVDTFNSTNWYPTGGLATCHGHYTSIGTYTVKFVLINANVRVDSNIQSITYLGCQSFSFFSYNDLNNNCVYDLGDILNYFPLTIEVDSNNIIVDTITSCGIYAQHQAPVGTIFKYKVIATPPGITVTCPISGTFYDTVFNSNQTTSGSFALNCAAVAAYDLAENVTVCFKPTWGSIHVNVTNTDCNGANATLTMIKSPKIPAGAIYPTPTTQVGNTLTWNFNVAAYIPQYITILPDTPFNPQLTIGDTMHNSFYLTPTAGDTDISNNTVIRVDTIKAAYDPNFKDVYPQGDITAGTKLKYTIHFENTGNDTALNIHVLDTLSDNVLPNTFNLVSTTAAVYTNVFKYGANHYILKFDFPNIKLPDSSHHGKNEAMIVYTLDTKPTLTPGTYITNRAGIYFDVNPVVVTNQVVNKIHIPESVKVLNSAKAALYPNPVTDILSITTDAKAYNTVDITNTIGQLMMKQSLKQNDTKINVKALPPGIYFANLKGEAGNKTIKFEKL